MNNVCAALCAKSWLRVSTVGYLGCPASGRFGSGIRGWILVGFIVTYDLYGAMVLHVEYRRKLVISALCPLSPSPSSRPTKRRDPSTPPPDGLSFPYPQNNRATAHTRSIAVHSTSNRAYHTLYISAKLRIDSTTHTSLHAKLGTSHSKA